MNRESLLLELASTLQEWTDGDEPVVTADVVDEDTLGVEFEGGERFFIKVEEV
jgi:hypothetical protein